MDLQAMDRAELACLQNAILYLNMALLSLQTQHPDHRVDLSQWPRIVIDVPSTDAAYTPAADEVATYEPEADADVGDYMESLKDDYEADYEVDAETLEIHLQNVIADMRAAMAEKKAEMKARGEPEFSFDRRRMMRHRNPPTEIPPAETPEPADRADLKPALSALPEAERWVSSGKDSETAAEPAETVEKTEAEIANPADRTSPEVAGSDRGVVEADASVANPLDTSQKYGKPWTRQDDDKAVQLVSEGYGLEDIGAKIGRTHESVKYRFKTKLRDRVEAVRSGMVRMVEAEDAPVRVTFSAAHRPHSRPAPETTVFSNLDSAILARIERLPSNGFDPAIDLELMSRQTNGEKLAFISADLGIDLQRLKARFRDLCGGADPTMELQQGLVRALKKRVAEAA